MCFKCKSFGKRDVCGASADWNNGTRKVNKHLDMDFALEPREFPVSMNVSAVYSKHIRGGGEGGGGRESWAF